MTARSALTKLMAAAATALCLLCMAMTASAAPMSASDEKNVRAVVQAQLAAFASDDAVKAFSFAAPNVRKAVGTADAFIAMVRRDYPVVYRPSSVAFLKPESKDGQVVQRVRMSDAQGASWLAVYSLQQQANKAWRITGCAVVESKGLMT